jgi:hypothetical protein
MLVLAAAFVVAGCGAAQPPTADKPAVVVPIEGTDLSKVILTQEAADRIGIKTAPAEIVAVAGGAKKTAIPLAAVVYDPDGVTWVYTKVERLTFVRERVIIGSLKGDLAILQSGPSPGVEVVIVGAAELLGSEYGVEGE